MGDRRGCAALCFHLDATEHWPPERALWAHGRHALAHLANVVDDVLPSGWEEELEAYLSSDEALWCSRVLSRRLQQLELEAGRWAQQWPMAEESEEEPLWLTEVQSGEESVDPQPGEVPWRGRSLS